MARLPRSYYTSAPVEQLAQALLGKVLCTHLGGVFTAGIISETEAYHERERACHAFGGKQTGRTRMLFEAGGLTYVYLCYGIHHLFNVVTGTAGEAEAVLIRAVVPCEGEAIMLQRRKMMRRQPNLSSGPGTLSQALGITTAMNGAALDGDEIWLEDRAVRIEQKDVICGPRIGVDYAGKDALLPWRFHVQASLIEKKLCR